MKSPISGTHATAGLSGGGACRERRFVPNHEDSLTAGRAVRSSVGGDARMGQARPCAGRIQRRRPVVCYGSSSLGAPPRAGGIPVVTRRRSAEHAMGWRSQGQRPFPERHLIHQDDRSLILLRQEQEPWDSGVMTRLSNDLRGELPGHESPVPHEPAVHAGVRGGVATGRFNFPTARWEIAVGHLCTLLDQLRTPTSEAGTPTLMAGPAGFLKITLRQAYTSASGWRTKHIHRAIGRCGRRSGSGNCPGSVLFRFA